VPVRCSRRVLGAMPCRGHLTVSSAQQEGTRVRATIPLDTNEPVIEPLMGPSSHTRCRTPPSST
jgi:hypothetical protein